VPNRSTTATDATGYLVVAHGGAGGATTAAVRAATGRLSEHRPTELRWTDDRDDLEVALDQLDDRLLVVAGGDGSIHVALDAVRHRHHRPRLGVIPAGTGNDLARALGLPLDAVDAADRIVGGGLRARPVLRTVAPDRSTADGPAWVVNAVHLGVGAAAAERAGALKDPLGRAAYPAASLAVGITHEPRTARVEVDGAVVHDGPALAVLALVGESLGGGVRPAGDAIDEPAATVVVIASARPRERLGLALAVLRGRLPDREGALVRRGRSIRVDPDPPEPLNVDGELHTATGPLRARWAPDAWELVGG
jgi:diacylglycerol kinase family enzyme